MLFVHDRVRNRVLKFENSGASVVLDIPLPNSAVLGGTKQTSVFKIEVVDLVNMTNQRSQLVNFVRLLG